MKKAITVCLTIFQSLIILAGGSNNDFKNESEKRRLIFHDTEEILTEYQIPYEKVVFQTAKQYELTVFRLVSLVQNDAGKRRPFVFFQHGILDSSSSWVLHGSLSSLPLTLSEYGFDVWLGNTRGNIYGYKHENVLPNAYEFWDFGLDGMAEDLDSILDKIKDKTENQEMYYVGHSMGTTLFYMYCANNPEKCNRHVKGMISLAPVAYLSHMNGLLKFFSKFARQLKRFLKFAMKGKLLTKNTMTFLVKSKHTYKLIRDCFVNILKLMGSRKFSPSRGKVDYTPVNNSANIFVHFAQICLSGKFRKYDYGKDKNLIKYGTEEPPAYNLNSIKIPVALYFAKKDTLSNKKDVEVLRRELEWVTTYYMIEDKRFNHVDFTVGRKVQFLYDKITRLILDIELGKITRKADNSLEKQHNDTNTHNSSVLDEGDEEFDNSHTKDNKSQNENYLHENDESSNEDDIRNVPISITRFEEDTDNPYSVINE